MLRIGVFGGLEVRTDAGPAALPTSRRARALLAWLAVHPGSHPRAAVAARFWPDVLDSSARTSLRGAVAELRRSLGDDADRVRATRESLTLDHEGVWVDLLAFQQCLLEERWADAADLARGPVLPEVTDGWADDLRERHAGDLAVALSRGASAAEAQGRLDEAVRLAERRVRLDPLSEVAGRELVRLLAATGDRSAALEAGRALSARLHEDLGVEPEAETRGLLRALRAGDRPHAGRPQVAAGLGPLSPPVVRRAATDLLGRDEVLARIRDVRLGDARLVLLTGDAGIGKTAAALAAAHHAAQEGATVLYGRCDEEAVLPYSCWVEALAGVFDQLEPAQARDLVPAGRQDLARLLPALAAPDVRDLSAGPGTEPDTQRWRLFDAVASVLGTLAGSHPVVVVLDDVHWADRSSLLLLRHVLRTRAEHHLTVVMTARADELVADSPVERALAQIRRSEPLELVEVHGLAEDDVARLARRHRGDGLAPGLTRALHQETEGNPFFVEEILRSAPHPAPDDIGPAAAFVVPDSVADVVRRRLRGLDDLTRTVLELASVVGRDFEVRLLEAALGVDREALVGGLDRAREAHLVVERGVGAFTFRHALIRATLHDGLSLSRRALLHLKAARALETLRSAGHPVSAASVAHHYLGSDDPAELESVLEALATAHAEALDQLAYEDAAGHALHAVAFLERHRAGDERVARLLVEAGEAQLLAGEDPAARASFERAVALARERGDRRLLAVAALGLAGPSWRKIGVVDERDVEVLEEALAALDGSEPDLRARVQARLAVALHYAGRPGQVAELTDAAVATARETGALPAVAAALEARLWAVSRPDRVPERLAVADELLAAAQAHRAGELVTLARRWRVITLLDQGRMAEVWEESGRHARDAERLRLPHELLYVAVFTTMRAVLEGRLDDVAAGAARVAAFGELRGGSNVAQYLAVYDLLDAQLRGRLGDLTPALEQLVEGYPGVPGWRAVLAHVLARTGRREDAAAHVTRLWPPEEVLPLDAIWLVAMHFLCLAVVDLGDRDGAAHLYRLLLPHDRQPVVIGAGGVVWGTASVPLAALAGLLGDDESAERHRRAAEDDRAAMGAVLWPALAQPGAVPGIR